jgi:hypothetical protein
MGDNVASTCSSGAGGSVGAVRQIINLRLAPWTAVVSNLHHGLIVLHANWSVYLKTTASSVTHSGSAYAELEVDAFVLDTTTGGGYWNGYTHSEHITGNNTTIATYSARIVFPFNFTSTAGDSYLFVIAVAETVQASSGYSGATGTASLDIGTGVHRFVVLLLRA